MIYVDELPHLHIIFSVEWERILLDEVSGEIERIIQYGKFIMLSDVEDDMQQIKFLLDVISCHSAQ